MKIFTYGECGLLQQARGSTAATLPNHSVKPILGSPLDCRPPKFGAYPLEGSCLEGRLCDVSDAVAEQVAAELGEDYQRATVTLACGTEAQVFLGTFNEAGVYPPALSIPVSASELAALRVAADKRNLSLEKYVKHAALAVAGDIIREEV